jgi:hypothetical protein
MNLHSMIQSFTGRPEEMVQIVPKHCKNQKCMTSALLTHIPCHQFMDAEKPSTQNPNFQKTLNPKSNF